MKTRLTGQAGGHSNALLAAVGHNFRKLLRGMFFALIPRVVGWLNPVTTVA